MATKILGWNIRGWKARKEEAKERIRPYDVVILTETKIRRKEEIVVREFNIVNKIRKEKKGKRKGGGVTVIIKNGRRFERITNLKIT